MPLRGRMTVGSELVRVRVPGTGPVWVGVKISCRVQVVLGVRLAGAMGQVPGETV